ncbi:MAG: hypothetical protein HFH71_03075, partial [Clostridia bacterium]|nr:hypothetical protein [Clostridia bacterium]
LGSNDYSYTGGEELVEGDNTVTVSYGELSASIVVKAGELVEGGILSLDKYVSKKLYLITIIAVGVLLLACVVMAGVIIGNNKKTRDYLHEIADLRRGGSEINSSDNAYNKGADDVED